MVGPLAIDPLKEAAHERARDFQKRAGGFPSAKELVVIRNGSTAIVSVPPFERDHVALLYDLSTSPSGRHGWWRLSDGEWTVTFKACRHRSYGQGTTQYNGGFIVGGPRCVFLDVRIGDQKPKRVAVSFGTGSPLCPLEAERNRT